MTLFILSFVAGVLTVAAPCIFTLLPIIVGGSLARSGSDTTSNWRRPLIIATSLVVSIVAFTLLLKVSTSLLGIPTIFWQLLSGLIIILLGINLARPGGWEVISSKLGLNTTSNKLLGLSLSKNGKTGDIITGAALGPVFASCSPTYAFLVASVIPSSLAEGVLYLSAYAFGLGGALLLVSYGGQSIVQKLGWLKDPESKFRKSVGIIFIIVGISVLFSLDKKLEANLLNAGWYDSIGNLEENLKN